MSRSVFRMVLLAIDVPIAVVLLVALAGMIGRYLEFRRQAAQFETQIVAARQRAMEDIEQAPQLQELLDQQTEATLARQTRTRVDVVVLAAAAVLFLVLAKAALALGEPATPSLQRIQTVKQHAARRPGRRWRRARPSGNGQPEPPSDWSFVDRVVAEEGAAAEAAIPILQRIQSHYRYLPDEALQRVCQLTDISPSQIAGVSTFYSQFRRSPVGKHIIKVCHGTACHVSGAREISEEIRRRLKIAPDSDTDAERLFTVEEVACLGCCSLAPVIMIDEATAGKLTPASACEAVEDYRAEHST